MLINSKMRKTNEALGILKICVIYIAEKQNLAKEFMGQLLSKPYCWHKLTFNWRRFKWRGNEI